MRSLNAKCCYSLLGIFLLSGTSGINGALASSFPYEFKTKPSHASTADKDIQTATFGAGCFWCVEAVYQRLRGIESVTSGYMGGTLPNPTYKAVMTGQTGHAEVIQIKFDANEISYQDLLEVLFEVHDPTTLNRQGNDVGTQYRSAIFYHDSSQKDEAEHYIEKLTKEKKFRRKIVTEVTAASTFYIAEDYHQDYFNRNPYNQYCRATIPPKLRKLQKNFKDKLKE